MRQVHLTPLHLPPGSLHAAGTWRPSRPEQQWLPFDSQKLVVVEICTGSISAATPRHTMAHLAPETNGKADSLHGVGVPPDEEPAKKNAVEVVPAGKPQETPINWHEACVLCQSSKGCGRRDAHRLAFKYASCPML